jgi:hypothetical protein
MMCDVSDPEYAEIRSLSWLGLSLFSGCFALLWVLLVRAHQSDSPGLGEFTFIADKFEERYYYWEMMIVIRKTLLMAIFLLFNPVAAILLVTFLTIVCLCFHIAARPYEDDGTDWTEMLSLVAQLCTLVSGPVFTVLVRSIAHLNENVLHSRCLPRWGHVALDLDASVPFHPSSEPVCVDFVV